MLEIVTLGHLSIRINGEPVKLRTRKVEAILVYLASFFLLGVLAAGLIRPPYLWLFPVLLGARAVADLALLFPVLGYYGCRKLLWVFLPLEMIYFMYVSVTGAAGILLPFSWKGRKTSM